MATATGAATATQRRPSSSARARLTDGPFGRRPRIGEPARSSHRPPLPPPASDLVWAWARRGGASRFHPPASDRTAHSRSARCHSARAGLARGHPGGQPAPASPRITVRSNQVRLGLPPEVARTEGPPRTRPHRMGQSRSPPPGAGALRACSQPRAPERQLLVAAVTIPGRNRFQCQCYLTHRRRRMRRNPHPCRRDPRRRAGGRDRWRHAPWHSRDPRSGGGDVHPRPRCRHRVVHGHLERRAVRGGG
jgi:hypothetical protein